MSRLTRYEEYHIQSMIGIISNDSMNTRAESVCVSFTQQIMGRDESPAFRIGPYITFYIFDGFRRCREAIALTWVSLRGRSSAACYRGWLSWCKRHGSQRSQTPLCSAAPGPDMTGEGRFKGVVLTNTVFLDKVMPTSGQLDCTN